MYEYGKFSTKKKNALNTHLFALLYWSATVAERIRNAIARIMNDFHIYHILTRPQISTILHKHTHTIPNLQAKKRKKNIRNYVKQYEISRSYIPHTRIHTHTQIERKPKSKFDQLSIALSQNTKKNIYQF